MKLKKELRKVKPPLLCVCICTEKIFLFYQHLISVTQKKKMIMKIKQPEINAIKKKYLFRKKRIIIKLLFYFIILFCGKVDTLFWTKIIFENDNLYKKKFMKRKKKYWNYLKPVS